MRVILGVMNFGPDRAAGARVTDIAQFNEALDLFQQRGYGELDTARVYARGKQEDFTRQARWKERGLALATKVKYPDTPGDNGNDGVVSSVETSLKELGADCVDILYLHAADRATPFAYTLRTLDRLHKQGKFLRLGLSNFPAFEVAEIVMTCQHNGWVRPTVYQAVYNVLTRTIEDELIPACRRYGLDIVVYNPLAGGLLSGRITSKAVVPDEGRFSGPAGSFGAIYRGRYFKESTFQALQMMEEAVERHGDGLTMTEVALRWLVHHSALKTKDGNDGIIIGVSSLDHLRSNLDYLEQGPLPESLVDVLNEAWRITKADAVKYWHFDLQYQYDTREELFGSKSK